MSGWWPARNWADAAMPADPVKPETRREWDFGEPLAKAIGRRGTLGKRREQRLAPRSNARFVALVGVAV